MINTKYLNKVDKMISTLMNDPKINSYSWILVTALGIISYAVIREKKKLLNTN